MASQFAGKPLSHTQTAVRGERCPNFREEASTVSADCSHVFGKWKGTSLQASLAAGDKKKSRNASTPINSSATAICQPYQIHSDYSFISYLISCEVHQTLSNNY